MGQTNTLRLPVKTFDQWKQVILLYFCSTVLIFAIFAQGPPTFLLAIPATIVLHYIVNYVAVLLLYRKWKKKHAEIITLLGIAKEDYYELTFAQKEQPSYFEMKFLQEEGFALNSENEVKAEKIVGSEALDKAKDEFMHAKQRLSKTRCVLNVMKRGKILSEDAKPIHDIIVTGHFKAAYKAISEAKVKINTIINRAKDAHCWGEILSRFESRENILAKTADRVIRDSRFLLNSARNLGIEKQAIATLESEGYAAAKKLVDDAKWLDDSKKSVISTLRREISKYEGMPGHEIFLQKLDDLRNLTYDDPEFEPLKEDLRDGIKSMEKLRLQDQE